MTAPRFDTTSADPSDRRFIRRAMNTPMLSREKEFDLARRWSESRDERALHELTMAHARLAVSIAMKYRHYGLPISDLVQEANIGLMQAAERFDTSRDVRFSTYAGWWIRAAVQEYVLRNWSLVRTGTTAAQKTLFFKLRQARARIARGGDGVMDSAMRSEIAEMLRVPVETVEEMEPRLASRDLSISTPVGDEEGMTIEEMLVDAGPTPADIVEELRDSQTRSRWLMRALKELSSREQRIIRTRHLTDNVVTLEYLGEELGISKERVRQIEAKALGKLKQFIAQVQVPEHV